MISTIKFRYPDKIQGTWQVVKMIETWESNPMKWDSDVKCFLLSMQTVAFGAGSQIASILKPSYTLSGNSLAVNISKVKRMVKNGILFSI